VFGRWSKCLISTCLGKEITLKSKCLGKADVEKKSRYFIGRNHLVSDRRLL